MTILRQPMAQCTAAVLNRLFDTALSASDLDFHIGRYPVRLTELGRSVYVQESWHNISGSFLESVNGLVTLMGAEQADAEGGWRKIGIGCAVLAGILGELLRQDAFDPETGITFCAAAGDFTQIMSAWYLRRWGFPIGAIVCACREEDSIWELIHSGTFRTERFVPRELERMIFHLTDPMETGWYAECCIAGKTFLASEELQEALSGEFSPYVISAERIRATIAGEFGKRRYLLPPDTAAAFSAVQDHRIRTRIHRPALITAEYSPARTPDTVARALRVSRESFLEYWKNR